MKKTLGILGIVAGLVLGVYVGLWLCFVGGILGLVTAVVALLGGKILAGVIAWSVIKIMCAGLFGYLAGAVLIIPSYALIVSGK